MGWDIVYVWWNGRDVKETVLFTSVYYSGICLKGLKKITKHTQDCDISGFHGGDFEDNSFLGYSTL